MRLRLRLGSAALSLLLATSPDPAAAAPRDTLPDTWEAVDGLGRALPSAQTAGPPNQHAVLVFYYIWHQRSAAAAPYDNTKIIAGKTQPFTDAAFGPSPAFHHWGEPALGYYDINDEFVLRRHAQLLSDAGVDAIVLDVTNAATYDTTWQKLCNVYADLRASGNRTPAISFIAHSSSDATVQHLFDTLYSKDQCAGLMYSYQGKPLIMAARGSGLSAAARDFFTFRESWAWTDANGWFGDGQDKWPWLDNYPQKWGWHASAQVPEEMPVGVAQHPTGNYGRSHHAGKQPPLDANYNTADTAKGLGFQEQWDRVIESQPQLVFVTQWNEWIAQRFVKCGQFDTGATQFMGKPLNCGDTHFIDDFNQEFSRDLEPMRGGHQDAYYYQLVANVRRYKGARAVSQASSAKQLSSLKAEDFADVGPNYLDDIGDVTHRSALGYAGPQRYENSTGRNDFELLRVARDADSLYFYAKTHAALSPSTDPRWMVLWLDTDGDAKTGCAGFEYAVNRSRSGAVASVERCAGAFKWQSVGEARFVAVGSELTMSVPRIALELPPTAGALSFRFKWTDNVPEPLAALDLLELGDSAPNGRFLYRYTTSLDIDPTQPVAAGGATGAGGAAGAGGATGQGGMTPSSAGGGVSGSVDRGGAGGAAGAPPSGGAALTSVAGEAGGCSCRWRGASGSRHRDLGIFLLSAWFLGRRRRLGRRAGVLPRRPGLC